MQSPSNAQKTPFARSLEKFSKKRALDAYNAMGKGLPASVVKVTGSIVEVNFEVESPPWHLPNVTCPIVSPEYIRYPTQVGDKGVVIPFDVLLGAISGLGGNTARLTIPPANLGSLVWTAVSNVNWVAALDPDKIELYGPNGFYFHDTDANCKITGDKENLTIEAKTTLTLKVGSKQIVINSSGVTIDGILWDTHHHTGVTVGGGNTGGPA